MSNESSQTFYSDYDARGLLIRYNTTFSVWNTVDQNIVSRYYNGDGREVKRQRTIFAEDVEMTEPPYGTWTIEVPTYYIRSSVLGDETLTEVSGTGKKVKTYIIAAGAKIAEQKQYYGTTTTQQVFFENWDAAGISRRTVTATGTAFLWDGGEESPVEADPMGGNVGTSTPYIEIVPPWEPPEEYPNLLPLLDDSPIYVNGQRVTCSLDGFAIGCSQARSMLENGSAIPAALAAYQHLPGFRFEHRGLGIYSYSYTTSGSNSAPPPPGVPNNPDVTYGTRNQTVTGYFSIAWTNISWVPQRQTQDEPGTRVVAVKGNRDQNEDAIPKDCEELLKNLGILDAVKKFLKEGPFIDIDTIENEPASNYAKYYRGSMPMGIWFDKPGRAALTMRGDDREEGIYYRSSQVGKELSNAPKLKLHEAVHLAFPPKLPERSTGTLDDLFANAINLIPRPGETTSDAVTRFFNKDCNPQELK